MSAITRRTFVKGIAAGTALAAAPAMARTITGRPVRIGIVGLGVSGTQHLHAFAAMNADMAVVTAIADPDPSARAKAASYATIESMADGYALVARSDVDALVIATPEDAHAPLSLAALEAGKHVYCEPPMALTLNEAEAIAERATAKDCAYAIGVTPLSDPRIAHAKALIAQGSIGPVRGIHMRYPYAPTPGWRLNPAQCGGVVSDMFYEKLLPAMELLGEYTPKTVAVAGGSYNTHETWDAAVVHATFTSGARIALATAPTDQGESSIIVRGERATLTFKDNAVHIAAEPAHRETLNSGTFTSPTAENSQVTAWLAAIHGQAPRNTQLDLALAGQRIIQHGLHA